MVDREALAGGKAGRGTGGGHAGARRYAATALQQDAAAGGGNNVSGDGRDDGAGGIDVSCARIGLVGICCQGQHLAREHLDPFLQDQRVAGADGRAASDRVNLLIRKYGDRLVKRRVDRVQINVGSGDNPFSLRDGATRAELHVLTGLDAIDGLAVPPTGDNATDLHRTGVGDGDVALVGQGFDLANSRSDGLGELTDISGGLQPQLAGRHVRNARSSPI